MNNARLKKFVRYLLRLTAVLGSLLLLAWLLVVGIVSFKKPELLKKISAEVKNRTGGVASIGNIDISFFSHFPHLTIQLFHVTLQDSLWQQHHHDLLKAESIDLRVSLLSSLFAGKPRVGKIFLTTGSVYLYTDSSGYSNTSVLHRKDDSSSKDGVKDSGKDGAKDKAEMELPEISLTDMKFVLEKQDKKKLFDFDIRRLEGSFQRNKRDLFIDLRLDVRVNSFAFNTEKGSFLKDKPLSGVLHLQFNTASKILQANRQKLQIDNHPFVLSGRFFPEINPDPFSLTLEAENIPYKKATSLVTPLIQQKLDQYDIDKPVSLHATLDAGSADDPLPQITVKMSVVNGKVTTPIGLFTEASFTGSFTNEWVHGHKREDENSGIRLVAFSASWSGIPLKTDTVSIFNLKRPLLATTLHSKFELVKLNDITGSKSIQFRKGVGELKVAYRGALSGNDTTASYLTGSLDIDSGAVSYQPYRFLLTDCTGKMRFKDQDLVIDRLEAHAGSSKLIVKGSARNFFSLLDQNQKPVSMDWSLSSPRLDLRDFTAILGNRVSPAASASGKGGKTDKPVLGSPGSRLDRFLSDGDLHLQIEAADLLYKNFSGAHAKAELVFSDNIIRLTRMEIEQGHGFINLSGSLFRKQGAPNPITLQSHIEQADLPGVFTAFNNFGQQALQDKNLKGKLTADIQLTGAMTDKAVLIQNSLKGTVNFSVKGGQLLDFEPMEKIQVAVMKKRDLSEIHFAELKSQLDLDTTTLTIHRMEIQSTAFTLFTEGTYDWKKGADLSLQVPLSNLKKDRNPDIAPTNKGTDSKTGISLRLRAKTGDDGKLKISWDPFKRALKKARASEPNAPAAPAAAAVKKNH